MFSALRSALALGFASVLVILTMPACSQQGEGERCDAVKSGNEDCESGLTCVGKDQLLDKVTDRCCPAEGVGSDKRCTRGTVGSGSGGTSAGGSSAGSGGSETGGTSTETGGTSTETGGTSTETQAGAAGAPEAGSGG